MKGEGMAIGDSMTDNGVQWKLLARDVGDEVIVTLWRRGPAEYVVWFDDIIEGKGRGITRWGRPAARRVYGKILGGAK